MKFVILAAGLGTRLMPLTEKRSKTMLPVANKPFLEWIVNTIKDLGGVILVVGPDQKDIMNYFKDCTIVHQEKPLGTANAIAVCEKYVDDRFVVINGDCLFSKEDVEKFSKLEGYGMVVFSKKDTRLFGTVSVKDGFVVDITEKVSSDSGFVNAGMYMFDKGIFDAIRKIGLSKRGEYEITDSLDMLIKDGVKINAFKLTTWSTLGYPWDLLDINAKLLDKTGDMIGENVEIRPGAYIEHPVAIGDNSIIGPNCFIRKYSSIGKNCRVGNAVEIKNSIIMDNTNVSHLSYVGDSIIGENCNVGGGTVFANLRLDEKTIGMLIKADKIDSGRKKLGAVVGDNVKFGVNVTVMPGKKIWSNLLIPPCIKIKKDVEQQLEF